MKAKLVEVMRCFEIDLGEQGKLIYKIEDAWNLYDVILGFRTVADVVSDGNKILFYILDGQDTPETLAEIEVAVQDWIACQ